MRFFPTKAETGELAPSLFPTDECCVGEFM
jgi:hypothetical protein